MWPFFNARRHPANRSNPLRLVLQFAPHRNLRDDVFVLSPVFPDHEGQILFMQQFESGQALTKSSKSFGTVCTIQKIRRIGVLGHPGIRRTDDQNAAGFQV